MLELTFDADARSLYCYFTTIEEGHDTGERDLPGMFLLDAAGQIIGVRLDTSDATGLHFDYATQHTGVSSSSTDLTVRFAAGDVAQEEELPYGAILDMDDQGRVLGMETPAMIEFQIANRLQALQPLLLEVYASDDDDEHGDSEPLTPPPTPAPPTNLIDASEEVRSGFVALVGKPNVGKSTLLNAYLGQKVSIVSPKPQTTRVPLRGILNGPNAQIVFIDTPGIHQPRHKLGKFMVEVARRAIPDADLLCFVVDVSEPPSRLDREIATLVLSARQPHILVLNKVDATREADVHLRQYRDLGPWQEEIVVSATEGIGLPRLLELIVEHLPVGPRLYPEDQLSDISERELAAEMIREKVMLNTEQEIPHSIAVEVEEWEDRGKLIYIRANISVERDSQKGIIIGAGGTMLRKIGAAARYEIERVLERQVYLDLWVKVRENWRQNANELRWLGYDVKFFKG